MSLVPFTSPTVASDSPRFIRLGEGHYLLAYDAVGVSLEVAQVRHVGEDALLGEACFHGAPILGCPHVRPALSAGPRDELRRDQIGRAHV